MKGRYNIKKILIVVDMQKDFVDGSLGSDQAVAIVEIVTGILSNSFKDSKKSKMPYFVLVFISCLIENLLYPTVLMIFCFKRVPIKDLFPCCQSNKKYQRDGTIINLLENS